MNNEIKKNIKISQNFLEKKDFENAEIILLKNLEISKENFETFFLLGTINGIKNNIDKAESYLKRALDLNPSHKNTNLNLAIIFKKLKKINDSIEYFKKVLTLDKRNLEALCGVAQIYEEKKDLYKAKKYYEEALKIDSVHHVANHNYGKLLLKLNKHKEGLKFIEKVSGIIRFNSRKLEII